MDSLEAAMAEVEEEISELRRKRAELGSALHGLENRRRLLEGKPAAGHHHLCPHCGDYAVCPQAYGGPCPLEPSTPADCRDSSSDDGWLE